MESPRASAASLQSIQAADTLALLICLFLTLSRRAKTIPPASAHVVTLKRRKPLDTCTLRPDCLPGSFRVDVISRLSGQRRPITGLRNLRVQNIQETLLRLGLNSKHAHSEVHHLRSLMSPQCTQCRSNSLKMEVESIWELKMQTSFCALLVDFAYFASHKAFRRAGAAFFAVELY